MPATIGKFRAFQSKFIDGTPCEYQSWQIEDNPNLLNQCIQEGRLEELELGQCSDEFIQEKNEYWYPRIGSYQEEFASAYKCILSDGMFLQSQNDNIDLFRSVDIVFDHCRESDLDEGIECADAETIRSTLELTRHFVMFQYTQIDMKEIDQPKQKIINLRRMNVATG